MSFGFLGRKLFTGIFTLALAGIPVIGIARAEGTIGPSAEPMKMGQPGGADTSNQEILFAPPVQGQKVLTLQQLLQMASKNYPKVQQARARLSMKRSTLWEARTAPFTEFVLEGGLGIAPTVRGTPVLSPSSDAALTENMALAWQMGVKGIIPLWTFGKITNLWRLAEADIQLGRHELKKEKNEIQFEVRRAFYGLQLARDSLLLVGQALKQLAKFEAQLEEQVEEGEADEGDLFKFKMQVAELEAQQSEARQQAAFALSGLRFFSGIDEDFDIPDEPLERLPHELGPVARYLEAARLFRPEINMARAGIAARRAQVLIERAKYLPDFGLALQAKMGRADEVTDQRNPYAYDRANFRSYGLGLVMRWKLDLLPQAARVAKAEAQLEEVRAIERFAVGGVAVEVEKAWSQVKDAKTRLHAWTRATQFAKQWMISVKNGLDLGISEESDMVEPSKEYALKKFKELSTVYDYNLAVARLAQATGWDGMLATSRERESSGPTAYQRSK
ncbi:MAG: TolC family protein [Polyangiaceae bacterium]|nr:TolC family protein [Polyangiaceae bacterium]